MIAAILFITFATAKRNVSLGLLIAYSFLVMVTTIIGRSPGEHASVILTPFWSYKEMSSNDFIWFEVRANILLFIPIGFLLPLSIKKNSLFWGIGFSILIEMVQLVTHRGTCETDDVISNTFGILIGYFTLIVLKTLLSLLLGWWKKLQK